MTTESADLTVGEVARRLRVGPETIRRWLRSGKLRGISLGPGRAGWRIPTSELARFREERSQ